MSSISKKVSLFGKLLFFAIGVSALASFGIFDGEASARSPNISIRILDDTATSEISNLSFDFIISETGSTSTSRTVVEVNTNNITGYKLYVESDYQDNSGDYTTSLITKDGTASIDTSAGTTGSFWNYVNPLLSSTIPIPAHNSPDKIAQSFIPVSAEQTNVDINIGIDSNTARGVYRNQLLFTAIANASPIGYRLNFDPNLPSGSSPSQLDDFPNDQEGASTATSYDFSIPTGTPVLTGYTFSDYTNTEDITESYEPGDDVTVLANTSSSTPNNDGEKTLQANWKVNNNTVTLNYDDTKVASATMSIANADPTASTTLSADYGEIVNIHYTLNKGYSFSFYTATYVDTLTGNTETLPIVIDPTASASSGSAHFTMPDGPVTIAINTTTNNYDVTINASAGIKYTTGSGSYKYGSTVTVGYDLKTGYHFGGWSTVSGEVTVDNYNQFTMPSNDVIIMANAVANSYTIVFNSNGGSGSMDNQSFSYDAAQNLTPNQFSRLGYTFQGWCTVATSVVDSSNANSACADVSGTYYSDNQLISNLTTEDNVTINLYAMWSLGQFTLTVDPNGGIWNASASPQNFSQNYGATKSIADPSGNASYTVTYYANEQGASYSNTSVALTRNFTGWILSGTGGGNANGSWNANTKVYTYGPGNDTMTADYEHSISFALQSITKTGHTCKWAEGSTSGTQYDGGTSRTISGNTSYYAICTANKYTLTVNPNGGIWNTSTSSQDFTQDYNTTKKIDNPSSNATYTISYDDNSQGASYTPAPTSAERAFSSWSLTKTGGGTTTGSWNPINKTYTYGTENDTLTANYNDTSNTFTLPVIIKSEYSCKWAEDSPSGAQYDGGTTRTVTKDTTYYVVCTINQYTLTVDPNGGTWNSGTSPQNFTQDYNTTKKIDNPSSNATYTISYDDNSQGASYTGSPTSVERAFSFWSLTKTGGGTATGTWNSTSKVYTYGAGNDTLTANYNSTSNSFTLPAISKDGYTCKWAEGSTSGTQYEGGTSRTITANTTYFAVCTINQYTLTVNPNGGTWNSSTSSQTFSQNYNTTKNIADPTAGPTYTITYYDNSQGASYTGSPTSVERAFSFWSLTKTGGGTATGTWNSTSKVYTYGAGNDTLAASYSNTSNSFTLPAISKDGYTCKWAEGSTSGTQYEGGTSRTITANTTYFAVCTINQYTLTVNPNGGTWNSSTSSQTFSQNYNTTKNIADPTAGPTYTVTYYANSQGASYDNTNVYPERAFSSWSLTKTGGGIATGSWNSSTSTYTYGTGNDTLTASYGSSASVTLQSISKAGHSCKWAEGSASGTLYTAGTERTISGNTSYYAVCNANSHTVTVNTSTGISAVTGSGTYNYGAEVTLGYTESTGYTFSSWTVNSGGVTITNNKFTMPDNDVEITASATINQYTLTVNPNGGTWNSSTSSQTFSQNYNTTKNIADPTAGPSHTITYYANSQGASYTGSPTSVERPFSSWSLTKTGGGTATGSWNSTTKVYTYGAGNDTLTANYSDTSNSFTLPAISKDGYTCKWAEGSTSGTKYDGGTSRTISGNTSYYAVCTINSHTVTVNAGTGIASTTGGGSYDYGDTVTVGYTLSTGYHFSSWTVNSGGVTINNNNQFAMPDSNVEVTANAAANSYSVSFNNNSGSGTMSSQPFTYGTAQNLSSNTFTRTGHTFEGWCTKSTSVTSTGNGSTACTNASGTFYTNGQSVSNLTSTNNGTVTLYAVWSINQYTLTVNPNGGTWNSSTSSQTFTQNYNTTKTIANPTGPTYTVTYYANSQGASYDNTYAYPERAFSSWSLTKTGGGTATGTWNSSTSTYTYGLGNDTLTASYASSASVTLQSISKAGHTCKWAEGSASGTQYDASTSRTISGNTAYYAVCTPNTYTINITNSDTSTTNSSNTSITSISVAYGGSATVKVTPKAGYYLGNVSCPEGYTCTGYNTGASYTGTQTITITNGSTEAGGTLSLTGATTLTTIATATNMQDVKACPTSLTTGTQYTLTDAGEATKSYTVSKLADNKCWMTQNYNVSGGKVLGSQYYNVPSSGYTLPASSTSDFSDNTTAYVYNDTTYGGYYSWKAATAGTSPSSGTASYDICPKGWRLPTKAEFDTLKSKYTTGATLTASPVNMKYGGLYNSSSPSGQGSDGGYWSSSAVSSTIAYRLYLDSSSARTGNLGKRYGLSVRCVWDDRTIADATYMQDVTTSMFNNTAIGATKTLIDAGEPEKSYAVTKLTDGKLWMTDNYNVSGGKTLSSEYYNVPSSGCNINGTDCTLPASSTSGFSSDTTARVYNDATYGGYYSWKAATAGTSPSSGTASNDICPKGWRLPTLAEFDTLKSKYTTGATLTASPVNMQYGGFQYDSSPSGQGRNGYYWSSSANNSMTAYRLYFSSSSAGTGSDRKRTGSSVRCVWDDRTIADATYMQDVTTSMFNNTAIGATKTLIDAGEPEKSYAVTKLADGKLWMTDNYNLSGGKTLSSEYYNVPSSGCNINGTDCTLPASSTSGFSSDTTANVYNDTTYGGYYSWKAATAGTSPDSGTASYDICPKGWRLPTQAEFDTLISKYAASSAGSNLTQSPVNMKYGGFYYDSSPYYQGSDGYYWSSSANSSANAYLLYFDSSSANTDYGSKRRGRSVRCVFGG